MYLVKDFTKVLEQKAPLAWQESYDNSGLQVGDPNMEVIGVLLCLDITEAVIEEALAKKCNLIIAHHPLLFSGLKNITGATYVERIVMKAMQHQIALYAAHTNMDNWKGGVNAKIAEKLKLTATHILAPASNDLNLLYCYAPSSLVSQIEQALFEAGAGQVGNYFNCSFQVEGRGGFQGNEASNPLIGVAGGDREVLAETRIEVLVPSHAINAVLVALRAAHTYDEIAYGIVPLKNKNQDLGAGMIGSLEQPLSESAFLSYLKQALPTAFIKHTELLGRPIQRVAVCGGSGSFLLKDAIRAKADVFITSDFKYHQFFDADKQLVIADIGHYESEQFTVEIFYSILNEKFPNFAILYSERNTNPVNYFI
jgi:dinuclear metal center YbgI/SA1388 family protein